MSSILFELPSSESRKLKDCVLRIWTELSERNSSVFKYKLDATKMKPKVLEGRYNFYVELNEDRTQLRRIPQIIRPVVPTFDDSGFNFNKVSPEEILCGVKFQGSIYSLIINNSPLTLYHTLICPDVQNNMPQVITKGCIEFSLNLLHAFDDKRFHIGFNSPLAMASVNHLHLHLIYLENRLYVSKVELKQLTERVYRISGGPIEGLCIPVYWPEEFNESAETAILIVDYLCAKDIPHNVFITCGEDKNRQLSHWRIFIFPRSAYTDNKLGNDMNVGFCELSGYAPVATEEIFSNLTEDEIVSKLNEQVGNIVDDIQTDILSIFQ